VDDRKFKIWQGHFGYIINKLKKDKIVKFSQLEEKIKIKNRNIEDFAGLNVARYGFWRKLKIIDYYKFYWNSLDCQRALCNNYGLNLFWTKIDREGNKIWQLQ